jgi:hypothetical protein
MDTLSSTETVWGGAAYLLLATAVTLTVWRGWRLSAAVLLLQYLLAAFVLDQGAGDRAGLGLALTGLFVALIFYGTGRLIGDRQAPAEAPLEWGRRLGLALLLTAVILFVGGRPDYLLPGMDAALNLAVYALIGLGLLAVGLHGRQLQSGVGLLTFLTGLSLLAASGSLVWSLLLAAAHLATAVTLSYLAQLLPAR